MINFVEDNYYFLSRMTNDWESEKFAIYVQLCSIWRNKNENDLMLVFKAVYDDRIIVGTLNKRQKDILIELSRSTKEINNVFRILTD